MTKYYEVIHIAAISKFIAREIQLLEHHKAIAKCVTCACQLNHPLPIAFMSI